jgi:hypothetical protein
MRVRVIAVAALALALSARAYAGEPAEGGSAAGSKGQAAGQESTGAASAAQPGEQGAGSASMEKDPAARAQETPQMQSVVGTVEKLEGDSLTVKSSPLSDPHQLKLSADTKFLRDGESISRDQISEGDQIRASLVGQGDSRTATEISLIKKGEGKAGPTQATPGSMSPSGTR